MKNYLLLILGILLVSSCVTIREDQTKSFGLFGKNKAQEHVEHYGELLSDPTRYDLASENWTDYFSVDLYEKNFVDNIDIFPLYFDAMGGHYPSFKLIRLMKSNGFEFKNNLSYSEKDQKKAVIAYTWPSFLSAGENRESLAKIKDKMSELKELQTSVSSLANGKIDQIGKEAEMNSIMDFYSTWNRYRDSVVIHNLSNFIKNSNKYDQILFFIPGYNIPYSMQVAQAERMRDSVQMYTNTTSTLIIPIHWPAGDSKRFDNWSKDNPIPSLTGWLSIKNRAYFLGYRLRQISKLIEKSNPKIRQKYFAHSTGAAAIMTLIADPGRGLDIGRDCVEICNGSPNEMVLHENCLGNRNHYRYMQYLSHSTPRLKTKVPVFFSAPAIGTSWRKTICDADGVQKSRSLYSSFNKKDPALRKKFGIGPVADVALAFKCKPQALFIDNSRVLSASTMGCREVSLSRVKETYNTLKSTPNLKNKSHNIFEYMRKIEYKDLFVEFLLESDN